MKLNITPALRKYVLPNMPYAMMFWFADKLGMAYRLAPGSDMLSKIIGSMKTLNAAMASSFPSLVPFDIIIPAPAAGIIYAVVYSKKKNAKKFRKDVECGSARWARRRVLNPTWSRIRKTTSS